MSTSNALSSAVIGIFYRDAYRQSLARKTEFVLQWQDALEFVIWNVNPIDDVRDVNGHTPAGQKADALIKSGIDHGWISRKARGEYTLNVESIKDTLLLK